MMDQRRQQLIEQYEDAALSLLMDEYANEEGERLLKEFEEAKKNGDLPEMPAELDAKCRKLIDQTFAKMERKERLKRIRKSVAKAAVLVFVLLGALSTMVMSVEALRVPILNFIIENRDRYSNLNFDEQSNPESSEDYYIIEQFEAMMPDGYKLVLKNILIDGVVSVCFQNDKGYAITLDICYPQGEMNIDTEDAEQRTVYLNDYEVLWIIKKGVRAIWVNSDKTLVYNLFANGLDENTFMELLCSIIE